ncbi:hypothetical protein [Lignipirellula cremea]|uniref:hypothetical protein n=1 Tax=Lignipirellula cremea TaxID=2528010 RepID=UPI0011A11128|nr:hypothetical protein [Lignipirellula cremea]
MLNDAGGQPCESFRTAGGYEKKSSHNRCQLLALDKIDSLELGAKVWVAPFAAGGTFCRWWHLLPLVAPFAAGGTFCRWHLLPLDVVTRPGAICGWSSSEAR